MACCRKSDVLSDDVSDLLREKLELLSIQLLQIKYPCILTKTGTVIVVLNKEDAPSVELAATIAMLRKTAIHFSKIVGVTGSQSLTISGERYNFTFHRLDSEHLLAYFSQSEYVSQYGLDPKRSDDVESKIVEDIRITMKKVLNS